MSKQLPQTVKLTNKASKALTSIKTKTGMSKQAIIERAVLLFEREASR